MPLKADEFFTATASAIQFLEEFAPDALAVRAAFGFSGIRQNASVRKVPKCIRDCRFGSVAKVRVVVKRWKMAARRGLPRPEADPLADGRRRFAAETAPAPAGVEAIGALDPRLRRRAQMLR